MKIYIVIAETYYEAYGSKKSIFGAYSSEELAKEAADRAREEIYKRGKEKSWSDLESIDEVEIDIQEIELDEYEELFVGGYCE